jgi:PAS domain S-box-containing protein
MNEGFAVLDQNWTVMRINAEGVRLTQRAAEDVVGKNHWEVWPELRNSPIEEIFCRVMATRKADVIEFPYTFPDGRKGWVETRAYPALDGGIACFFREISERKAAQEKLQDADRRKDEFLAMLAHELRNPLAPIGAAAELLQMAKLDEERVRQTSQIIGRQVQHMTSLVDDLLDVSRLTRGLVVLDNAPLDIRHIVADAVEQVTSLIQSRRHHFALHLPPDTSMVMGDKKRLVQVIANVLNNAAKYTQEGGNIVLKVEVHAAHVVIEVGDNGIGMSPELTARVFDLFAQAERTPDRSSGGLGLGLALVKSLVELHHGTVTCESAGLGKGSRFTIYLPRLVQGSSQTDQQHVDSHMQQETDSLRILVVDDNVDAASMLAMLLETSGHRVMVEHASRKALERAREERPHVCLLDIGLPEIDGNELAKQLRAQPETADAVLIAITGYGQENDRRQTLSAGFNHHLVKPVNTKTLAAILAEIGSSRPPSK